MVATREQDPFNELDSLWCASDDEEQSAQTELEYPIHQLGMPSEYEWR